MDDPCDCDCVDPCMRGFSCGDGCKCYPCRICHPKHFEENSMPDTKRRIHDYTKRYWGHDFTLTPHADPATAAITGWGHGLRVGDLLLIPRQAGGNCIYRIETIGWANNVDDMWFTTCQFVPGSSDLGRRVGEATAKQPVSALAVLGELGGWWVLDA